MSEQEPGGLWPADSPQDHQVREVYSRYGMAMYHVQVLEHGVANAIVAHTLFKDRANYASLEDWWGAIDKGFVSKLAQTFGNLLKNLENIAVIPKELLDRLRIAKEPRDVLAHRFFRLHIDDLQHESGRRKMIIWCEEQIEMFTALDRELETFYKATLEEAGVTLEWLATRLDEELEHQGVQRDIPFIH